MPPTGGDQGGENPTFWDFTKDDLLDMHELGRKGDLRLKDFKNTILYPFAWKTLGYEIWLRDIRNAFKQRLLQTVKGRIDDKALLNRLDVLARDLGSQISKMIDRKTTPSEPIQPVEKALLIRAKIKAQVEEVIHYLEAAGMALGQAASLDLTQGRDSAGTLYRDLAERSHSPAIQMYYHKKAKYLDHLKRSPGTPFYPGRPPKRKLEAPWYPAVRRRGDALGVPPWRPIYRPWADERKFPAGANDWDRLELRIAERMRGTKRKADELEAAPKYRTAPPRRRTPLPAAPPPTPAKVVVAHEIDEEEEEGAEGRHSDNESHDGLFSEKLPVPDPVQPSIAADDKPGDDKPRHDLSDDLEADLLAALNSPDRDDQKPSQKRPKRDNRPVRRAPVEDDVQLTHAERQNLQYLEGQNTSYRPTIPQIRLPQRRASNWKKHYEHLERLLAHASARGYWDNLDDRVAAQAVGQIAAEVEALVPAAMRVMQGQELALGFDGVEGLSAAEFARSAATLFFVYNRQPVKAVKMFKWRSQPDYAIGRVYYDGTKVQGDGAFKGDVGVI